MTQIRRPNKGKWKYWRRDIATGAVLSMMATAMAISQSGVASATTATMSMDWARAICGNVDLQGFNLQGSGLPADNALMVDGVLSSNGVHYEEGITVKGDGTYVDTQPFFTAADNTTAPDAGGTITFNVYDTNQPPNLITSFGPFTVDQCDHLPVAANDSATTTEGNATAPIPVLSNDTDADPGTTLTVGTLMSPNNGTAVVNPDNTVTYTPFAGFVGTDTFQYYPNDGLWDSNQPATVTVTVNPSTTTTLQISNLQSTCGTAGFTGHADVSGTPNDTDTYVIQAQLADTTNYPDDFHGPFTPSGGEFHGTVDWQNMIGWESQPPTTAMAVQFDLYDYTASLHLASLSSTLPACTPANSPPVGNNDSYNVAYNTATAMNVLANDTDANGNTLTVTNLTQPSHGSVSVNVDKTVEYTPSSGYTGSDSFTYTPNDGTVNGNVTTVNVTVQAPPNQPPTVGPCANVLLTRNVTDTINCSASDPNGDPLSFSWQANTSTCSFGSSNQPTTSITCTTPGSYTLTFTASDGHNPPVSSTATLLVRYEPNNREVPTGNHPHKADGAVSLTLGNIADVGAADLDTACLVINGAYNCKPAVSIADGQSAPVMVWSGLPEGSYTYHITMSGDPTDYHGSVSVVTLPVLHFTAACAKYAVTKGYYKGKAKCTLNNYWSGKGVYSFVKDGFGHWHKYWLSRFQVKTVYVPTPKGLHKDYVYRLAGTIKKLVYYRYVVRLV